MGKGNKVTFNPSLFSSKSGEWETPDVLFQLLNEIFDFKLDVCAQPHNAKCKEYFTLQDNGLVQSWKNYESCWMNPPYGREIGNWVAKAFWESWDYKITVVGLLPARTDTKWWHSYVMKAQQIWFIRGRIKFVGGESSAPFPSCIVIWMGTNWTKTPIIRSWNWK